MFPIHHVLPQFLARHPVINFLANRFNIDGIRNRMALPATQELADDLKSSPHSGGHLASYFNGFDKYLDKVNISEEFKAGLAGRQWQLDEVVSDLNKLLAAAKYAQANGHLFPNTPTGMTREQANAANEEWFSNWRRYAEDNGEQIQQMLDTIDQLSASGQWAGALHWPILSPASGLSLADRIEIRRRYLGGSPISQHFTAVGPVPALPGLVPSFVDTRLPGFIPPPVDGLNQPKGFRPSNPSLTYGVPGFPPLDPAWQRIGQPPPSAAAPSLPQFPQFHSETSHQMFLSDGSPMMGPNPYDTGLNTLPKGSSGWAPSSSSTTGSSVAPWLVGAAALGAAAVFFPAWFLAALGLGAVAGAASGHGLESGSANSADVGDGSAFSRGTSTFASLNRDNIAGGGSRSFSGPTTGLPLMGLLPEPESGRINTVADRFGSWTETPAGTMPAQSPSVSDAPAASAAGAAAPEEVRCLTRVNASNAGSVFESGSSPVPYLPSPEFNNRFGNWSMPTGEDRSQQTSRPIGAFADEPSHVAPPPIWGLEDPGNPRTDAEEWFSRWIRPMLRQE